MGWVGVTPGIHRAVGPPEHVFRSELLAWQTLLPRGGGFTHLTAARAHGLRLPPLPELTPVFAVMGFGDSRPQRRGLVVRRERSTPLVEPVDGVRLAPPPDLLLACASDLGLLDLVPMVDGVLAESARAGGLHEMREAVAAVARPRRRGARTLSTALELADHRAESWWESVLRLFHWSVDVPVVPQHAVVVEGEVVAHGDLLIEGTHTLQEYDGAVHRSSSAQRVDLKRERALGRSPYRRNGYTSVDLLHQPAGVLRDADRALGREHDPGRLQRWYELLQESAHTSQGRAALLDRWQRRAGSGLSTSRRPAA